MGIAQLWMTWLRLKSFHALSLYITINPDHISLLSKATLSETAMTKTSISLSTAFLLCAGIVLYSPIAFAATDAMVKDCTAQWNKMEADKTTPAGATLESFLKTCKPTADTAMKKPVAKNKKKPTAAMTETPAAPADAAAVKTEAPADVTTTKPVDATMKKPVMAKKKKIKPPADTTMKKPEAPADTTMKTPEVPADTTTQKPEAPADVAMKKPEAKKMKKKVMAPADATMKKPEAPADAATKTPEAPADVAMKKPEAKKMKKPAAPAEAAMTKPAEKAMKKPTEIATKKPAAAVDPVQQARITECGNQWKALKVSNKVPAGQTWPKFWGQCVAKMKAAGK
jgi:hypothetical protein